MLTRRRFLATSSALVAAASWRVPEAAATWAPLETQWPIAIFEKVFEALRYDELADALVQIGADGVEATIRPGGHIEPLRAAEEVPKMATAMQQRGKRILIAATGIDQANDAARDLLLVLKAAGITHYRMAHYRLVYDQPLKRQVANYASRRGNWRR